MSRDSVFVSPIGRVSFPALFEPDTFGDQKPKYSVTLIFGEEADVSDLRKRIQDAVRGKWGPEAAKKLLDPAKSPSFWRPLRECGEKPSYVELGYDESDTFAKFSTEYRPVCMAPDKRLIQEDDGRIYAGCYGRVSYEIGCWESQGKKGVTLYLKGFQFARAGERIGGSGSVDLGFDELPADDSLVDVFDEDLI